jgi:hypothetical protein
MRLATADLLSSPALVLARGSEEPRGRKNWETSGKIRKDSTMGVECLLRYGVGVKSQEVVERRTLMNRLFLALIITTASAAMLSAPLHAAASPAEARGDIICQKGDCAPQRKGGSDIGGL